MACHRLQLNIHMFIWDITIFVLWYMGFVAILGIYESNYQVLFVSPAKHGGHIGIMSPSL